MCPHVASGMKLLERRPREEQPLLADVAEADDRLRLVTIPDQVDDHAFAEGLVPDVVADAQVAQARRRRRGGVDRGGHDRLAMRAGAAADRPRLAPPLDALFG